MLADVLADLRMPPAPVPGWPFPVHIGLVEQLCDALSRPQPVRYAADGWLHASQLYDLCTRQAAIVTEQVPPPQARARVIDVGPRVVFDVGKAVAWVVRQHYLGPMGLLYGVWVCRCGAAVEGLMPTAACACGGTDWQYRETVVQNADLKVIGSIDGLLPPRPELGIGMGDLEIKSMEWLLFRNLTAPVAAHVAQLQTYLALDGREWGVILYVSKSLDTTPFKEYGMKKNPAHEAWIRSVVEEVRRGGEKKCRHAETKRALNCFARSACFFGATIGPGRTGALGDSA